MAKRKQDEVSTKTQSGDEETEEADKSNDELGDNSSKRMREERPNSPYAIPGPSGVVVNARKTDEDPKRGVKTTRITVRNKLKIKYEI